MEVSITRNRTDKGEMLSLSKFSNENGLLLAVKVIGQNTRQTVGTRFLTGR